MVPDSLAGWLVEREGPIGLQPIRSNSPMDYSSWRVASNRVFVNSMLTFTNRNHREHGESAIARSTQDSPTKSHCRSSWRYSLGFVITICAISKVYHAFYQAQLHLVSSFALSYFLTLLNYYFRSYTWFYPTHIPYPVPAFPQPRSQHRSLSLSFSRWA